MKRIYTNFKSIKVFVIWFIGISTLYSIQSLVVKPDIGNIVSIWILAFCIVVFLELLNLYFSYINLYSDQSLRVIDWFYRKPRVHPNNIIAIGFVPSLMDKVFQQLFVKFKTNKGSTREFKINIKLFSQHTIAEILNHIITTNPEVKLDNYCQDLLDSYHKTPEKLEKNWQEKFKFKWPLSQVLTDVLMFVLLLASVYFFFHVATTHGWCWNRNHCYPGPMI